MKKLLILVFVLMGFAGVAMANPFLVSGPVAGAATYSVQNLGTLTNPAIPAQADGSLKLDLASLPPGTYNITVQACAGETDVWRSCSDPANFTFTRPAGLGSIPNIAITRQ